MATITPFGAAGEVTGSSYLVETSSSRILVDFGMFQGDKDDDAKNVVPGRIHRRTIDAIILTHGHLDHCGRLPMLVREGYAGPIYSTAATRDLAEIILEDSAHIQEMDYERHTRHAKRRNHKINRVDLPLYDATDVADTMKLFIDAEYGAEVVINDTFSFVMHEAGHMLGSASIALRVVEESKTTTIVFSGDIGPVNLPFLRDPMPPAHADVLVMESTYGNRNHRSLEETTAEFSSIISEAVNTGGRVFIPSFAIGRSQNILYYIAELIRSGAIPKIPMFLDSPMAIKASNMYARYNGLFDDESTELIESGQLRRDLSTLVFSRTADDSRSINTKRGPFITIAGSGMCNAGRILHHLRHSIEDRNSHVVIVGYQSSGSLGRYLVDGSKHVMIMGKRYAVRAKIHTLGGFSAHAGKSQLIEWARAMSAGNPKTFLTHGEDDARTELVTALKEEIGIDSYLPAYGEQLSV